MLAFPLLVSALAVLVVLIVARPLLRTPAPARTADHEIDTAAWRERLTELDTELENGAITAAEHAAARVELERAALDALEPAAARPVPAIAGASPRVAVLVAMIVSGIAFGLYTMLGTPQALGPAATAPGNAASDPQAQMIAGMITKLEQRLRAEPDDGNGWKMLARSYVVLGRDADALQAYREARARLPDDPEVLAGYAESLAQSANGNLRGEPAALLERAIGLAPEEPKVLWLAGAAAFQSGDYPRAIERFDKLRGMASLGAQERRLVDDILERARRGGAPAGATVASAEQAPEDAAAASPKPAASLSVTVRIAPELRAAASPDDTVFVFARAATGPRMPLAVVRKTVADLPFTVALDDSLAMNPAMKLSQFSEVVVGARVSRSGSATPSPGDLTGESGPTGRATGPVEIVIDRKTQ